MASSDIRRYERLVFSLFIYFFAFSFLGFFWAAFATSLPQTR
jgi:hypothetical protein